MLNAVLAMIASIHKRSMTPAVLYIMIPMVWNVLEIFMDVLRMRLSVANVVPASTLVLERMRIALLMSVLLIREGSSRTMILLMCSRIIYEVDK
jgi:hypothetical protein